jgi:hypothetical protein
VKHLFNKIVSIFLSLLILFTTTSFALSLHYCCNELVDIGFFNNASSCKILITEKEIPSKVCTFEKETCCLERAIFHEGNETVQKTSLILTTAPFVFLNPSVNIYIFESLKKDFTPFKDYSPPYLITDIHIINNIFLI